MMKTKIDPRKESKKSHQDGNSLGSHPDDSLSALLHSFAEIGKQIPAEDLAKIPRDAAMNLEYYMYGSPKESD